MKIVNKPTVESIVLAYNRVGLGSAHMALCTGMDSHPAKAIPKESANVVIPSENSLSSWGI